MVSPIGELLLPHVTPDQLLHLLHVYLVFVQALVDLGQEALAHFDAAPGCPLGALGFHLNVALDGAQALKVILLLRFQLLLGSDVVRVPGRLQLLEFSWIGSLEERSVPGGSLGCPAPSIAHVDDVHLTDVLVLLLLLEHVPSLLPVLRLERVRGRKARKPVVSCDVVNSLE